MKFTDFLIVMVILMFSVIGYLFLLDHANDVCEENGGRLMRNLSGTHECIYEVGNKK